MSLRERVIAAFHAQYGAGPAVMTRAPGRVNLIGEHTDYNDGFVLPLAIDRDVTIALRPRPDQVVRLTSLEFDETAIFHLDDLRRGDKGWTTYVSGVAWALRRAGHALRGWEGVMSGDVPLGAGLSSSAALELAVARAFASVSDLPWDVREMARLCRHVENEWVGVQCGIMDQMIAAAGRAGHALLIDCRTLAVEAVPLPAAFAIVIMDTTTRRGLVDSAYNERRAACAAAARFLGVPALRDVSLSMFHEQAAQMPAQLRRRARHVIGENARVLAAVRAMRNGNAGTLGRLMNESHDSLRDNYDVSSDALNQMVNLARRQPGCLGARMTGAGFGGCAVALVAAESAPAFVTAVSAAYEKATHLTPALYICAATDGASACATDGASACATDGASACATDGASACATDGASACATSSLR